MRAPAQLGNLKIPLLPGVLVVARRVAEIKVTYDERTEDGFNGSLGLDRLQEYLENPEKML
jgi:hypothetical protein